MQSLEINSSKCNDINYSKNDVRKASILLKNILVANSKIQSSLLKTGASFNNSVTLTVG